MKVSVTRSCLEDGTPSSCTQCPVALALKRMGASNVLVWSEYHRKEIYVKKIKHIIIVHEVHCRFFYENSWIHRLAPDSVVKFIEQYDRTSSSTWPDSNKIRSAPSVVVKEFEFDM